MNFTFIDIIVIFLYLIGISVIGLWRTTAKRTENDYFLGEKKISTFLLMISIVATETSSLTFLSIPGLSYKTDYRFLQLALGYIVGRVLVAAFILPLYYSETSISIYAYIGEKFGSGTRKVVSCTFLASRILGDGVRLYITSIPVALVLKNSIMKNQSDITIGIITLAIISVITILYTVYGGFSSVILTDAFQFFIYIFGALISIYFLLPLLSDSIYETLSSGEKLRIFTGIHGNGLWTSPYFFPIAVVGGMFISLGSHGADQLIAQRALACSTLKQAKRAMIGSGIIVFCQFAIFLFIGSLLYLYYKNLNTKQDEIFALFILEKIPTGFLGIIIAAILASAMSTLSGTINSLTLTTRIDLGLRLPFFKQAEMKVVSFLWGIVLFCSALLPFFMYEAIKTGMVELGLKISSYTLGPLLSLFLLRYVIKDQITDKIRSQFTWIFLLSLILTISTTIVTNPPFTIIIPIGIVSFSICTGMAYIWKLIKIKISHSSESSESSDRSFPQL